MVWLAVEGPTEREGEREREREREREADSERGRENVSLSRCVLARLSCHANLSSTASHFC